MKPQKRLALRRETMIELRTDELGHLVAGNEPVNSHACASIALCTGYSCSVCSGYCPTYTCPPALETILP